MWAYWLSRHFFPLNPIHALNILLAEIQLFLCKVSNFIVTFQEKGGKKWEYDEFFFQNQENAGESGSIAALRELSQKDKNEYSITVLQFYFKGCAFSQFYLILYIYIYNIKFFQKKGDALK